LIVVSRLATKICYLSTPEVFRTKLVNVLTVGSQGTQKKGDEQKKARYFALYLNKHENHGQVIANDMWQMLLKLYINNTKKCWVFLQIHRKATAENIS
jgi:hypothetical protein